VNQKDKAEVIAIVQSIPAIFRDADKTIAVCEYDGIYDCCATAIKTFSNANDLLKVLYAHTEKVHESHLYEESYLQRL
jgi:hypothetical protein